MDSSTGANSAPPDTGFAYDAATDGMMVAPKMTRILGDTLGIKMYEVISKPGDSIPLHSHPDHAFYVIQGGKAAIYFGSDRPRMGIEAQGWVLSMVQSKMPQKILVKQTSNF